MSYSYEPSTVRQFLEVIEEKNDRIVRLQNYAEELRTKLFYLLENHIESSDGCFTFPDGDTLDCKRNNMLASQEKQLLKE